MRIALPQGRGTWLALSAVLALGAGSAAAVAGIPGPDGEIRGCYQTGTDASGFPGRLRVLTNESSECPSGEVEITWNQQGRPGPAGAPGQNGTSGANGANGAPGPQGAPGAPAQTPALPSPGAPQSPTDAFDGSVVRANATYDMFVKVAGVDGESTVSAYRDWLDLDAFAFSITQTAPAGNGSGSGRGKTVFSTFDLVKPSSPSSLKLLGLATTGRHVPTVDVELVRRGEKPRKVISYKLSDVLVASYGTESAGREKVALTFSRLTMTYWTQRPDGSVKGETTTYELKTGTMR